ncbi:MAG: tRNA dihydrouridine synthase DusB [Gammaproteobacteria bacterium]|nr:tRNA dihydrouridine synthase DusB [Gammaproteobacteria bacterium]
MAIGPYQLKNRLLLAPMAGVTDRPFRQLCRRLGAAMAVSEMVSCNSLLWGSSKTLRRADHQGEESPRSVQIMGADPAMMAAAARHNVDHGAEIIDINMGCPAKKVCNVQAGSALLRDETLVAQILDAVIGAVPEVPVTLKIRTGWDQQQRNGVRIAQIAQNCGIAALAVHGRTRADLYRGEAEYATIAAIKQAVTIPVIANGDITSPEKAAEVLASTAADGLMIGRAAQGRPWIFNEINHYLITGERLPPPSLSTIKALLMDHLSHLYHFYGERTGVLMARKHIGWYSKGQRDGGAFRQDINHAATSSEQLLLLEHFFNHLMTVSGGTDELGE